jgi:2-polyprenyl-3-methyl-5-hydroxy-6-metoxy-1,4-benzoquinol methylase
VSTALLHTFDVTAYPHEAVPCNQCGGSDLTVLATSDRYGLPVTTVRCDACRLRFINPRMTAAGYAAFYAKHYRPLLTALMGTPHSPDIVRENQRKYAVTLLREVTAWVEPLPESRLLDLGGSTGIVARAFAERWDCESTVVDPAPEEVIQAGDFATPICGTAEEVRFTPGRFDVILMCRTIEHLRDP